MMSTTTVPMRKNWCVVPLGYMHQSAIRMLACCWSSMLLGTPRSMASSRMSWYHWSSCMLVCHWFTVSCIRSVFRAIIAGCEAPTRLPVDVRVLCVCGLSDSSCFCTLWSSRSSSLSSCHALGPGEHDSCVRGALSVVDGAVVRVSARFGCCRHNDDPCASSLLSVSHASSSSRLAGAGNVEFGALGLLAVAEGSMRGPL